MSVPSPRLADDPADRVAPHLAELRAAVRGPVLTADDPDLLLEAAAFNLAVTHRPVVVVGATSAEDVAAAVRWASRLGFGVGVQATGHGIARPVEDAVLVTTSRMAQVSVDPVGRTARVAAGARWAEVIEAAAEHGLAPLSGSSSTVGAVGYTLGGGVGLMAREHGFAADHVRSLELVTADGDMRRVDAVSEPDLFWALRGGKGSFGIVTTMEISLFPVTVLFGGSLFFDGSSARSVLEAYRQWAPALPEQMSTAIALMRMPPLDFVPEPLRGRLTVALKVSFTGSEADGQALLAPMLAAGEVIFGGIGVMPYTAADAIHNDPKDGVPVWERGGLLRELTAEAVEALLAAAGPDVQLPLAKIELRQLGGALARQAAVENAVSGREGAYVLHAIGMLAPGLEEAVPAAGAGLMAAMVPWLTGTAQLNFLGEAPTPEAVAATWEPATRERLQRIKAEVDPGNVFRFGHAVGALTSARTA